MVPVGPTAGLAQGVVARCPTESKSPVALLPAGSSRMKEQEQEPTHGSATAHRQRTRLGRFDGVQSQALTPGRSKGSPSGSGKLKRLSRCFAEEAVPFGRSLYYDYYKATVSNTDFLLSAPSHTPVPLGRTAETLSPAPAVYGSPTLSAAAAAAAATGTGCTPQQHGGVSNRASMLSPLMAGRSARSQPMTPKLSIAELNAVLGQSLEGGGAAGVETETVEWRYSASKAARAAHQGAASWAGSELCSLERSRAVSTPKSKSCMGAAGLTPTLHADKHGLVGKSVPCSLQAQNTGSSPQDNDEDEDNIPLARLTKKSSRPRGAAGGLVAGVVKGGSAAGGRSGGPVEAGGAAAGVSVAASAPKPDSARAPETLIDVAGGAPTTSNVATAIPAPTAAAAGAAAPAARAGAAAAAVVKRAERAGAPVSGAALASWTVAAPAPAPALVGPATAAQRAAAAPTAGAAALAVRTMAAAAAGEPLLPGKKRRGRPSNNNLQPDKAAALATASATLSKHSVSSAPKSAPAAAATANPMPKDGVRPASGSSSIPTVAAAALNSVLRTDILPASKAPSAAAAASCTPQQQINSIGRPPRTPLTGSKRKVAPEAIPQVAAGPVRHASSAGSSPHNASQPQTSRTPSQAPASPPLLEPVPEDEGSPMYMDVAAFLRPCFPKDAAALDAALIKAGGGMMDPGSCLAAACTAVNRGAACPEGSEEEMPDVAIAVAVAPTSGAFAGGMGISAAREQQQQGQRDGSMGQAIGEGSCLGGDPSADVVPPSSKRRHMSPGGPALESGSFSTAAFPTPVPPEATAARCHSANPVLVTASTAPDLPSVTTTPPGSMADGSLRPSIIPFRVPTSAGRLGSQPNQPDATVLMMAQAGIDAAFVKRRGQQKAASPAAPRAARSVAVELDMGVTRTTLLKASSSRRSRGAEMLRAAKAAVTTSAPAASPATTATPGASSMAEEPNLPACAEKTPDQGLPDQRPHLLGSATVPSPPHRTQSGSTPWPTRPHQSSELFRQPHATPPQQVESSLRTTPPPFPAQSPPSATATLPLHGSAAACPTDGTTPQFACDASPALCVSEAPTPLSQPTLTVASHGTAASMSGRALYESAAGVVPLTCSRGVEHLQPCSSSAVASSGKAFGSCAAVDVSDRAGAGGAVHIDRAAAESCAAVGRSSKVSESCAPVADGDRVSESCAQGAGTQAKPTSCLRKRLHASSPAADDKYHRTMVGGGTEAKASEAEAGTLDQGMVEVKTLDQPTAVAVEAGSVFAAGAGDAAADVDFSAASASASAAADTIAGASASAAAETSADVGAAVDAATKAAAAVQLQAACGKASSAPTTAPSTTPTTAASVIDPWVRRRQQQQRFITASTARVASSAYAPSIGPGRLSWLQPPPTTVLTMPTHAADTRSGSGGLGGAAVHGSGATNEDVPGLMDVPRYLVAQPARQTQPQLFQRQGTSNAAPKARKASTCTPAIYTLEQELRDCFMNCQLADEWHNNKAPWARMDIAGLETGLTSYATQETRLEHCRKKLATYRGPESTAALQQRLGREWAHLKAMRIGTMFRSTARHLVLPQPKALSAILDKPSATLAEVQPTLAAVYSQQHCQEKENRQPGDARADAGLGREEDAGGVSDGGGRAEPVVQQGGAGNTDVANTEHMESSPCGAKKAQMLWEERTPISILRLYEASIGRRTSPVKKCVSFAPVLELGPKAGYNGV